MDSNFDSVDVTGGYKVDGVEVIDGDGEISNNALSAPALKALQFTVALADFTDNEDATGDYTHTVSIPKGAVVTQTLINSVTGFAGDTSATIQIGDGTDVDRYNTGTPNVFTTADTISAGAVSGTAFHSAAKAPVVTVTSDSDFTSVTAGAVTITIFYYEGV